MDASNTLAWRKEYNFKDHLGNNRLVFTDRNGNGVVDITGTASTSDVLQENHYYAFGMAFEGAWLQNDASIRDNKYQYNGKELNDDFGLNWNDYGARWYDAAIGRWNGVDAMAEATESFSPYQYVVGNPISNFDFFGLTDVDGDGKDDGTLLPEFVVTAKRNNNEKSLDNVQFLLDGAGLIPGAGTVAGIANAGIDLYRGKYVSAGINLVSAIPIVGSVIKGAKITVTGAKVISSLAKMKVLKAAIPAAMLKLRKAGQQIHHIIPKAVYNNNKNMFSQIPNFNIDDIDNLIPLNTPFHHNHPAYNDFVVKELTQLADKNGGQLTVSHINQTITNMKGVIQEALGSGMTLNNFMKSSNF